jgi:transcriptional regulator with XRE-family HTH domain
LVIVPGEIARPFLPLPTVWRALFGKNVRKYRQQRKLTQEELAFEAEIDLTYIGGIERGRRNPSLLVMARIADALSVQLPKLLSE